MTYDRNQLFANRIRLGDKTTEVTAFVNKELVFTKDIAPADGLSMAETFIKAALAALDYKPMPAPQPRDGHWIAGHGYHP